MLFTRSGNLNGCWNEDAHRKTGRGLIETPPCFALDAEVTDARLPRINAEIIFGYHFNMNLSSHDGLYHCLQKILSDSIGVLKLIEKMICPLLLLTVKNSVTI